jgi:hypothetical protein
MSSIAQTLQVVKENSDSSNMSQQNNSHMLIINQGGGLEKLPLASKRQGTGQQIIDNQP